jgi:hypothetical protein
LPLGFARVTDTSRDAIQSAIKSAIRHGVLGYGGGVTWGKNDGSRARLGKLIDPALVLGHGRVRLELGEYLNVPHNTRRRVA